MKSGLSNRDEIHLTNAWYSSYPVRGVVFSPREISALINQEILDQHVEEAGFLWNMRDRAARAHNYSLRDLAALDLRLEAHLEGLQVAGQHAYEACTEAITEPDPGAIFAAAVVTAPQAEDRFRAVALRSCESIELQRPLISALAWLPSPVAEPRIGDLLQSGSPEMRRLGIAASAARRFAVGPELSAAISSPHAGLRASGLKACGLFGLKMLSNHPAELISDSDEACRFFAAWSAARLGDRSTKVATLLRELALGESRFSLGALDMWLRIVDLREAKSWYLQFKEEPARLRLAVLAAGIIGDPEMMDDLIAYMADPRVARVAGRSASLITGVDLDREDLSGDMPEALKFETANADESDTEEDVIPTDQDEGLPWPIPASMSKWWKANQDRFEPGRRYLVGQEIPLGSLLDVLIFGNQYQRCAAALELGLADPEMPLFEVRAPGVSQLQRLGQWNW